MPNETPLIDDPNRPAFGGGGMTSEERRASHWRWAAKTKLKSGTMEYEMYEKGLQCGGCAFYIELTSDLGMDWGVCAHEKSPHDGTAVFEHHTCLHLTTREEKGEDCPACFGCGTIDCPTCLGTGKVPEEKEEKP